MTKFFKTVIKERWGYYFILPSFILYSVFFLFPVLWSMVLSFMDYGWWGTSFIGLENYRTVFNDRIFWIGIRNTIYYTAGVVPLWLGKAVIISALIFPFRKGIQTFFKAAFYLPHVTSSVIISMIWLWIYNPPFGLLNYLMQRMGFEPVTWLGNTSTAMAAMIFMTVVMGGGSSIVLISAAMNGIPSYLYEAADIDGASSMRMFWQITIPLLRPTLLYLVVMGTISSFQVFTNIYLMTQGGPQFSTSTIVYQIYEAAFSRFEFGRASAMAMVLFAFTFVFALFQFKWLGQEVEF